MVRALIGDGEIWVPVSTAVFLKGVKTPPLLSLTQYFLRKGWLKAPTSKIVFRLESL